MSRKRQNTSSEPDSPPSKRRTSPEYDSSSGYDGPSDSEQPQVDISTGQTGAFPGLNPDSEELFYGPASNGLEFLRMVRSEARGIPQLLTATKSNPTFEHHASAPTRHYEGFFGDDAAFVAAPLPSEEKDRSLGRAQQLYNESLLTIFNLARATLKCIPPLNSIQALHSSAPISFPPSSKSARESWEDYIKQHAPHPVQIACMDSDSVLQVVSLITKKMTVFFRSSEPDSVQRIGTWIWSILAKCPERGHLGSEEISVLRALAKRAHTTRQWVQSRTETVSEGANEELEGDVSEESDVTGSPLQGIQRVDTDQEKAGSKGSKSQGDIRLGLSNKTEGLPMSHQTFFSGKEVILDMIITVVGEVYGQRDLLESRHPWSIE